MWLLGINTTIYLISSFKTPTVKGSDDERKFGQLIEHYFPCHCLCSTPGQHPLQPPETLVVEFGMET